MKVEIRSDSVEVSGYVNAVGRDSRPLRDRGGYFVEQIQPGAFARSLARKQPVMLLNHDPRRVLSTRGRGLVVREDAVGLYARAEIIDRDVVEKARAGKLSGWSFGFNSPIQDETVIDGMRHRSIHDLNLVEVSLLDDTRTPAYIATSVITRDDSPDEELQVRDMPDVVETREAESLNDAPPGASAPQPPDLSAYTGIIETLSRTWDE